MGSKASGWIDVLQNYLLHTKVTRNKDIHISGFLTFVKLAPSQIARKGTVVTTVEVSNSSTMPCMY